MVITRMTGFMGQEDKPMKRTELVEGHYRKTGFYALSVMIGTNLY